MPHTIEDAQDVILGKINQICGKFGLNNIMAQLYAILYLNNKPLSLSELAGRLEVSKGSASVNMRALERYGVVRKIWVKGTRQDYYEAEYDIEKVVIQRARSMVQNRLSEVDEMIRFSEDILKEVKARDDIEEKAVGVFQSKLAAIKSFYDRSRTILDIFNIGQSDDAKR